jgi:DNA adenine methylase
VTRQLRHLSPLRYPGGKARLAPFIAGIFEQNRLNDGHYAEPYAGGAGVALALLASEHASIVHINDIDRGVYSFWHSVIFATDELCERIRDTPLTIEQWRAQRATYLDEREADPLAVGFATFYLNRTNRSGIVRGGMIGGVLQASSWNLDARFNRADLIARVQRCALFRDRIRITQLDAIDFLAGMATQLPERSLTYCDPPYFIKGRRKLYTNSYAPGDHEAVADTLASYPRPWIVSYDGVTEIRKLYNWAPGIEYDLNYAVSERYRGIEVMYFAPELRVHDVGNPAYINSRGGPGGSSRAARSATYR